MKKLTLLYIAVFAFLYAEAQIDRSKPPKPAPAPTINIAEAEMFTLKNGLKVYVVENHKLPRVSFSLSLKRDNLLEKEKVGYLSATGELLRRGTNSRTKDQLDEEIDFIGASLSTSAAGMYGSSLTKHSEKLLDLFTDVLYNPSFPEEELKKIIKQNKSNLAANKEDAGAIAGNVQSILFYGKDHPFGENTTEVSLDNITVADCKAYYQQYFKPNIAYLAIVGDIKLKQAKKLVKKHFENWEGGTVPSFKYEVPMAPEKTFVALVDRPNSVQSTIRIGYPLDLKPGTPDVIKARVLNQILGGGFSSRLMQNLREDKAFTYGARSSLANNELVGSFVASASVRNEVTDSAVHEFMYELNKIVESGVTQKELDAAKASIMGSFARSLESPQTIARFAINTAIFNLSEDYYTGYLKRLEAVTLEDVQAMAKKYIRPNNAYILVVGKGAEIATGLEKFGKVQYYDTDGVAYDPKDQMTLPEGVTSESVIEKYLESLGGKTVLAGVKDISLKYNAEVNGMAMQLTFARKDNDKLSQIVNMNGNPMMVKKYNKGKASIQQMGNALPIDDNMKASMAKEAILFQELDFKSAGIQVSIKNQDKINGRVVYGLEYKSGEEVSTHYFDAETGLLVRESKTAATPSGDMVLNTDILEYTSEGGVKVPSKIKIPFGPGMSVTAELVEVKVNSNLKDTIFE